MSSPQPTYTPIVQELVDYLSANPAFNAAFEQSFKKARAINLDEWTKNDINSVTDYIQYMNTYVHWVPREDTCENAHGTNVCGKDVYNHICLFYLVLDLPPLRDYQNLIHPSSRNPWTWLSEWLIRYAQEMGRWMDKPGSITPDTLQTFVDCPAYRDKGVSDFYHQYPDEQWTSFNEFFARKINPALRPIASEEVPTVIVCPADCAFGGKWDIHEESTVQFTDTDPSPDIEVELKGIPWSIRQLLDDVSPEYCSHFPGGVFAHAFLSPSNYHRLHAPVSGKVIQAKVIPGLCYLEVGTEPKPGEATTNGPPKQRLTMRRRMMPEMTIRPSLDGEEKPELVAPNSAGYQFLQARALILIESPEIGYVAVLPIGMAQVSSVLLSVKKNDTVKKGQEIACFNLGGSDVVVVFEKRANVDLSDWENRPECQPASSMDPNCESFTKYGCKIGTARPIPESQ